MAQVELFKKVGKYIDKRDGKEKPFTNFFVKCGSETIPVEVKTVKTTAILPVKRYYRRLPRNCPKSLKLRLKLQVIKGQQINGF